MSVKKSVNKFFGIVLLAGIFEEPEYLQDEKFVVEKKEKPTHVPRGCIQYFFEEDGTIRDYEVDDTIFNTVAMNEKSARKKFDKWRKKEILKMAKGDLIVSDVKVIE